MVQWLGLHTFTAEGASSIPGQGAEIPQATLQQKKKKKSYRHKCTPKLVIKNVKTFYMEVLCKLNI